MVDRQGGPEAAKGVQVDGAQVAGAHADGGDSEKMSEVGDSQDDSDSDSETETSSIFSSSAHNFGLADNSKVTKPDQQLASDPITWTYDDLITL